MSGYSGALSAMDMVGDYTATAFLVRQLLAEANHAALVEVIACTSSGGLAATGFVDVKPLVQMVDGGGVGHSHATVHHLKYFRLQGGANAVIIDPQPGDIGIAVFADRDSSTVIASEKEAPPGSGRRNDYADGFYFGAFLNGVPTQFVQFSSSGINITSPTAITLNGGGKQLVVNASGITLDGKLWETHEHSGVASGGSNTGGPV